MFPFSKGRMKLAAFGQGVLLALALSGGVRIINQLLWLEMSERVPGHVFLIGSLTFGSLFLFLYTRSPKQPVTAGVAATVSDRE